MGDLGLPTSGNSVTYDDLRKKYAGFDYPQVKIELDGQVFAEQHEDMLINDIHVELSSGFEASLARFRIYNVYDMQKSAFLFAEVKKHAILGISVSISLGYAGTLENVFTGFVASVDFCYETESVPYIEITGMDAKGVMMASSYAAQLTATSYGDGVKEVLQRTAYEKMKTANIITGISVSDTPDKEVGEGVSARAQTIEMVSESDYEFIVKAAKKFNFEFFVDRGNVIFRRARSVTTTLTDISPGMGILSFRLGYSLTGMVESIEVRSMDPGAGKVVSAKGTNSNNLSTAGKAKALVSGSKRVYIDPTVFTQEQANARLDSLMTQMSYRLGAVECECIGLPDIVPGRFVNIAVGSPGDNDFYITNVVHELSVTGEYRTRITGSANSVKQ
jgi:phage protein D